MGSWATDPFGNDSAADWASGLEDGGLDLIEETLRSVADTEDDYLEAPEADEAIAAADTVARMRGAFYERNAYTEIVDNWVAAHPGDPSPELIALALRALDRIEGPESELVELWDGDDEWEQHMAALRQRLS